MFNDDSYYNFKIFELLLVESDINEWVDSNPVMSSYDFILNFSKFIDIYINADYVGFSIKENILNYLNIVRFKNDLSINKLDTVSHNEKIHFINELIRKVNLQKGNKYIDYCRCELYKRTTNNYYLKCPEALIKKLENKLFDSIKFDYFVLISHTDNTNEDDFSNEFLIDLSNDTRYFETINCFLNEYPQLFSNTLFINRYNKVLNSILEDKDLNNNYLLLLSQNISSNSLKR